jgi:hypothetical protein
MSRGVLSRFNSGTWTCASLSTADDRAVIGLDLAIDDQQIQAEDGRIFDDHVLESLLKVKSCELDRLWPSCGHLP